MPFLPGRVAVKHALKRSAGVASALLSPFLAASGRGRACILMYHRVTPATVRDRDLDDWNVTPRVFERHMAWLAEAAEVVPLDQLGGRLAQPSEDTRASSRPLVCLTFDDGFANFHGEALPVLRRYGLPSTLFVVTKFVGSSGPMPFDHWSRRHWRETPARSWRPITWGEIDECVASGLVRIGSHSHVHRIGSAASPAEWRDETSESREMLRHRLGDGHAAAYAYPYGSSRPPLVPRGYVDAVRAAGYSLAVSTDLGLADVTSDRFWLPRVEAFGLDSPAVLRAKVNGALRPHAIPQWFRTARRSPANPERAEPPAGAGG